MSIAETVPATGLPVRSLAITAGLVIVVLSIVLPLPASVLDVGIALSIATATLILVMASLVEKPTDFQAFPVLLLVSLLIRLSLNVSSTRLILTHGQNGPDAAGHVINGFAEFVAGGSILVGLTVFIVIALVNFMVITKGAGRMAEVSARFALDSLPGKQLAIDGDLNSGAIDHEEAKRRRIQEQREISFYGSLDGASKFVKGDAVAGLVIMFINLFVGLAAGVLVHSMPIGEALSTYSKLTIGDGLVTQIPALITSMAAALLLSRGGATNNTADLLSSDMMANWQVPAVAAGGLMLVAMIPGMPLGIFLTLAIGLGVAAWVIRKRQLATPEVEKAEAEQQPALPAATSRIGDVLDTEEISVEIGAGLIISALDQGRGLGQRINNLRLHVARSWGVILPDVRITDGTGFADGEYVIRLQGVVRGRGVLLPQAVLALGPEDMLRDIPGQEVREPVYDSSAKWINPDRQEDAAIAGATVVIPMEVLSTHLMEIVKSNLSGLLTMSLMQRMIRELCSISDTHRAELNQRFFDAMIPDKVAPETLLAVLRGLLEERISIRNLVLITDAVHESRTAPTPEAIYELVRKRLRGQITEQFSTPDGYLDILQLHPQWEAEIARAELEAGRTGSAPVPQLQQRLVEALRKVQAGLPAGADPVLTVPDHRRRLIRMMLGASGVAVPVMGLDEIDPIAKIRLIGTVTP
ncbi:flagellar biosynthesis protein FlhA [Paracoccus shanxieyensis]|uniref:Flagellar type III secretion system protein FlhA n=1 Tax=Paracoccus shanxieyensis TaxID=2675752 RepID=A0A6L6J1Z1_9RHOB|nr:flagellar biosynthesis protein FlhA [Paracoccus shanxieyensis]MTH65848.1 flagellar type III secretion system protein FlhA [Paracoccus shanxieyensis]MTH89110.1 flagellar type III secretion system protein FlhA [Paracoccus shanxieyensis]